MKTCYTCHEEKPVSEFTRRKPGGPYRASCKVCWNRRERLRNNSNKEKHRVAAVKEREAIAMNPHGFLAAGIIEKSILDWRKYGHMKDGILKDHNKVKTEIVDVGAAARRNGHDNPHDELLAFFASDWFEELAGFAGCDPEYLRKHILEM